MPLYIYIYEGIENTQLLRGFDSESQESIKSLFHQRAIFKCYGSGIGKTYILLLEIFNYRDGFFK